jgi:uncharacterized protein (TIGR03000 family)
MIRNLYPALGSLLAASVLALTPAVALAQHHDSHRGGFGDARPYHSFAGIHPNAGHNWSGARPYTAHSWGGARPYAGHSWSGYRPYVGHTWVGTHGWSGYRPNLGHSWGGYRPNLGYGWGGSRLYSGYGWGSRGWGSYGSSYGWGGYRPSYGYSGLLGLLGLGLGYYGANYDLYTPGYSSYGLYTPGDYNLYTPGYNSYGLYGSDYDSYGAYTPGYSSYGLYTPDYDLYTPGYNSYGATTSSYPPAYGESAPGVTTPGKSSTVPTYPDDYPPVPGTEDSDDSSAPTRPAPAPEENPPAASAPAGADAPAHITVQVPVADAQVWFNGTKMKQTGTTREFATPPLSPGREYTYKVRTRWSEGGQWYEEAKKVKVRGGGQAVVNVVSAAETDAAPKQAQPPQPAGEGQPETP